MCLLVCPLLQADQIAVQSIRDPLSCDDAGEVLYNWRVFPLHLNEPPVVSLRGTKVRTAGTAALGRHLAESRDTLTAHDITEIQQGQAVDTGRAALQREGKVEQPEVQIDFGAAGSNKDKRIAWPQDGGLHHGPVVYRWILL